VTLPNRIYDRRRAALYDRFIDEWLVAEKRAWASSQRASPYRDLLDPAAAVDAGVAGPADDATTRLLISAIPSPNRLAKTSTFVYLMYFRSAKGSAPPFPFSTIRSFGGLHHFLEPTNCGPGHP